MQKKKTVCNSILIDILEWEKVINVNVLRMCYDDILNFKSLFKTAQYTLCSGTDRPKDMARTILLDVLNIHIYVYVHYAYVYCVDASFCLLHTFANYYCILFTHSQWFHTDYHRYE